MAYNLVRSNGSDVIVVHENNIDNYDTSLQYVGRFSKNYGLSMAQNTLRLLENFASNVAPENNPALGNGTPLNGQLWYDSGNVVMRYRKNGSWVSLVDIQTLNAGNFSASRWNDPLTLRLDSNNGHASGQVQFDGSEGTVDLQLLLNDEIPSNAASASKLKDSVSISLTGGVTGTTTFDGSSNVSISTTVSLSGTNGITISGNTISLESDITDEIDKISTIEGWGDHSQEGYAKFGTTNTTVRNNQELDARYSTSDTVTRVRGTTNGTFRSGDITLAGGGDVTITQDQGTITISATSSEGGPTYSAGVGISINASNSISVTNIASGSSSSGALRYNGTSRSDGRLYGGTAAPNSTTRLNYDGYLYATRFYTPSSIELKDITEIVDHEKSLSIVDSIGEYGTHIGYYKDDKTKSSTRWLIAEQVAKFSPEAVGYDGDKVISINYDQLIPDLYSSIHLLNKKIQELEKKVNK